jgi:hypothetical protein
LTEKSLRPIACGQPFILAGTHGSLEYLRSYGFKTFMHLWDERYDLIEDPEERLISVADLMRQIANWDDNTRENKMSQARTIAEYNQQHFFSEEFYTYITKELQNNLTIALTELENTNTSQRYINRRKQLSKVDYLKKIITGDKPILNSGFHNIQIQRTRKTIAMVVAKARQYYLRSLKTKK